MKVLVIGLGHVGIVTAACLLRDGHIIIGVDHDERIIDNLARGDFQIREDGAAELIGAGQASGRFRVSTNVADGIDADAALICVGTHGTGEGSLDLSELITALHAIGNVLRSRASSQPAMLLAVRSTMPLGSMTNAVLPELILAVGEPPGPRYEVIYAPEFSREGSAVADYFSPARIVIGERVEGGARLLLELYDNLDAPVFITSFKTAELTKLADNCFHALKVTFANEVGRFALRSGISPAEVFDIFRADTKLNISTSYLQPGVAFGGPCLTKDVRSLVASMNDVAVAAPIVGHIIESNILHTQFLIQEIERRVAPSSRVLLIGLSFKGGTDDLRNSPLVALAEILLKRGIDLKIYDPDLLHRSAPNARAYVAQWLPDYLLKNVVMELSSLISWDLVVLAKQCPDIMQIVGAGVPLFRIDRL